MSRYIQANKEKASDQLHVGFSAKLGGRLYAELHRKGEEKPSQTVGWFNSNGTKDIKTVDELKAEVKKWGWKLDKRVCTRLENEQKQYQDGKKIEQIPFRAIRNSVGTGIYYAKRAYEKVSLWLQEKPKEVKQKKEVNSVENTQVAQRKEQINAPYRVNTKNLQGNVTVIPAVATKDKEGERQQKQTEALKEIPSGKIIGQSPPESASSKHSFSLPDDRAAEGKEQQRQPKTASVIDKQVIDGKVYAAIQLHQEKKTVWFHRDMIESHSNRRILSDFRTMNQLSSRFETRVRDAKPHTLFYVHQFPEKGQTKFQGGTRSSKVLIKELAGRKQEEVIMFLAKHKDFHKTCVEPEQKKQQGNMKAVAAEVISAQQEQQQQQQQHKQEKSQSRGR